MLTNAPIGAIFLDMEKLLFSKEEVAEIIGLSKFTVARDIRAGKILSLRYGRRRLVPKAEIERIAASGLDAQPEPKPAA
jgi:excisionase family DNA binding protein